MNKLYKRLVILCCLRTISEYLREIWPALITEVKKFCIIQAKTNMLRWTCDTQVRSSHGQPEVDANEASRYRRQVDPLPFSPRLAYGVGLITTLLMLFAAGYLNCRLISSYRLPLVQSRRRERANETYITFCSVEVPRDFPRVVRSVNKREHSGVNSSREFSPRHQTSQTRYIWQTGIFNRTHLATS